MQMDFGLLTLAYCPLLLSPSFLCSIVSIAVPSQSFQLPNYDLFTSLALLSSFGRETSLVKITGPRSIFTSLFTPTIYFQLLLSLVLLLSLALILCKRKDGGIDNSSVLIGSKVICSVQVQVKEATFVLKTVPLFPCHLVYPLESYWFDLNLSIFAKGNLPLSTSTFHLGQPTRRVDQLCIT